MATERISLFDATKGILVEVNVSAANAERAATDTVFATQLLNKALNKQPQHSTSSDVADYNLIFLGDGTDNFIDEELLDSQDTCDPNSETQESEVSLYRWSPPCALLLLETYKSMEKNFNSGKLSQKIVSEKVSTVLNEKGYQVTGPQCFSKLRSLKKSYKSIKDHNNKSGNDRRSWPFFQVFFFHDHNFVKLCNISSSELDELVLSGVLF